jgi:hypothetical protein
MFRSISKLAFIALISVAGCGNPNGDDQLDPGETDDVINAKADGTTPLRMGTYDVNFAPYYSLTLHDDKNFQLMGGCNPDGTGPHCFAIIENDSYYRLTKSGSKHYIRLYNEIDGTLLYRFQYTVSGDMSQNVKLTNTKTGDKYTATLRQADKAQEGESCGGFVANVRGCAADLDCQAAARCCDLPGTCVRSSSSN